MLLTAAACATVVPPAGGPVDTTPPVPLLFKPHNKITNYSGEKITIKFDEYVQLKDLNSQLVISPAMPDDPDIYIQGKKLVIVPPDSLTPNTTYTIFLGNAVVNYKEGLPVKHFQYVLSTGENLDSLRITGKVKNAFDLKTEDGILVMLYKNASDSTPYLQRPYYIAKTYSDGGFLLDNLSEGKYLIFALKDLNSNYIYDQPAEEIAFLDSLLIPAPPKTADDSLNLIKPVKVDMYLFKEVEKNQGIKGKKLRSEHLVELYFKKPVTALGVGALNFDAPAEWNYPVFNKNRDSLKLWLTAKMPDTVLIKISDDLQVVDTLRLVLRKPKKQIKNNRRRQPEVETVSKPKPPVRISVKTNTGAGIDFFGKPALVFNTPVKYFDRQKIKLYRQIDTVYKPVSFSMFFDDSIAADRLYFDVKLEEESSYKIFIPDSVFFDIFGNTNDTIEARFGTTRQRNYGSLKLKVVYNDSIPLLIQLLNDKDGVLRQDMLTDSIVYYRWLKPGKYKIKAVKDRNGNGKWDTGNYLEGVLPERVFFMSSPVNIRANWDIEHKWIIE
jgi:putative transposon-encoded protein